MFTGIVKELGVVEKIENGSSTLTVTISGSVCTPKLNIDDSIAVNGVCLSVVEKNGSSFSSFIMNETKNKTTLAELKEGDNVNLESSVSLSDALSGHIVQGHVDGVCEIVERKSQDDGSVILSIKIAKEFEKYVVDKGSVALDGVSLTIMNVKKNIFKVSLIPHTLQITTLGFRNVGDKLNIELDVMAKYVAKYIEQFGLNNVK